MNQRLMPAALIVSLLILFITWTIFHHRETSLFPNASADNSAIFSYTDIADSGHSNCRTEIRDNKLLFYYTLAEGFPYPYSGMGLELAKHDSSGAVQSFFDMSGYDSLRIRVHSLHGTEIRIQILTFDPSISRTEDALSLRFLVQDMAVERAWQTKSLSLADFAIPDWWYKHNNLKPDPSNRNIDRAKVIEFQNGPRMPLQITDTLEISEITLVGESRSLGAILAGIALVLLAAFGFLSWLEREKLHSQRATQLAARREAVMGQAERLPLSSHRTEDAKRILEYIGKHYVDAELDLETVCRETGVNRNRLSAILKEEVGTTFKGHLTDLRLAEATRALAETDLQVTEIAYKIGFGNVSHFNRVFKEHFQIAPVEFRRTHKKLALPTSPKEV